MFANLPMSRMLLSAWRVDAVVRLLVDELDARALLARDGDELDVVVLVRAEVDARLLVGRVDVAERPEQAR